MSIARIAFLLTAAASFSTAYRPPVDTAGPLTVKIEGPAQIVDAGNPQALAVVLENAGGSALSGTIDVRGIDGWRIAPAGKCSFSVPAQGQTRLEFKVTP